MQTPSREETLPYEVDKPEAPPSRPPPPPSGDAPRDATLTGVSPFEVSEGVAKPSEPAPPRAASEPKPKDAPARRAVEEVASKSVIVAEEAKKTVSDVASRVGEGIRAASQTLAEQTAGDFETLLPTALPDDDAATDPLLATGARLARESDFWRRLALRSLGRAAYADRLGYAAGVVAVTGSVALAIVAALGGLFAGGNVGPGRALLILAGALALAVGSGAAVALTHVVRRTQRDLAQQALSRADAASAHQHRLATVLALRGTDAKAFRDAIGKLLDDPASHTPPVT